MLWNNSSEDLKGRVWRTMCAIVKTIFADFNPIIINFTHYLVHSLSSASNIVKHYQHSLLHNHSFILIQTSIIKVKKKENTKYRSDHIHAHFKMYMYIWERYLCFWLWIKTSVLWDFDLKFLYCPFIVYKCKTYKKEPIMKLSHKETPIFKISFLIGRPCWLSFYCRYHYFICPMITFKHSQQSPKSKMVWFVNG